MKSVLFPKRNNPPLQLEEYLYNNGKLTKIYYPNKMELADDILKFNWFFFN